MIRVATACVHVLGLQEGRNGIEDLWMLSRLTELVPSNIEVCRNHNLSSHSRWAFSVSLLSL
jgi:hypothetical protein